MSIWDEARAYEHVRMLAPDRVDELRREASRRGLTMEDVYHRVATNPKWPEPTAQEQQT